MSTAPQTQRLLTRTSVSGRRSLGVAKNAQAVLMMPKAKRMRSARRDAPSLRTPRCSASRSLTVCGAASSGRSEHSYRDSPAKKMKLAVLIDGENAQAAVIEPLLAEVAKYGTASVKRVYADWTKLHNRPWKTKLLKHSIQPIQQFSYTSGKNATDSALIIDAMDLLHSCTMDGFCLVSSDSDFTRLASRLREDGLLVIGFGERKTPEPFVHSCDKFVYTEVLRSRRDSNNSSGNGNGGTDSRGVKHGPIGPPWSKAQLMADNTLMWTLRTAIEDCVEESGWANLGLVGSIASAITPEFDCRNYGFKRLGQLLVSLKPDVEVSQNRMLVRMQGSYDEEENENSNGQDAPSQIPGRSSEEAPQKGGAKECKEAGEDKQVLRNLEAAAPESDSRGGSRRPPECLSTETPASEADSDDSSETDMQEEEPVMYCI